MKYKAGDRVRIKSIDWYNENKDKDGIVELSTRVFVPGMSEYCGTIVTIEDVFEDIDDNVVYYMEEVDFDWTDEMIEGLVEDEIIVTQKLKDSLRKTSKKYAGVKEDADLEEETYFNSYKVALIQAYEAGFKAALIAIREFIDDTIKNL